MKEIVIVEPAKSKYMLLTGQKKETFNRIVLTMARYKKYTIKDFILRVSADAGQQIKKIHYNDKQYFEIAFAINIHGKLIVSDYKCLF